MPSPPPRGCRHAFKRLVFPFPVVVTPLLAQNEPKKDTPNSLQSDIGAGLHGAVGDILNACLPSVSAACNVALANVHVPPLQCADVEAADVILIKDEDDMRGCGAADGETRAAYFFSTVFGRKKVSAQHVCRVRRAVTTSDDSSPEQEPW